MLSIPSNRLKDDFSAAPTSFNSGILTTSRLPSISSKSSKKGDVSGNAPLVRLFSFAFFYKSFKFLYLSVHCFFVFSPPYFDNSFLIESQTSLRRLDSMGLMFSFHNLTSFAVCLWFQLSLVHLLDAVSLFFFTFYWLFTVHSAVKLFLN